MPRVHVSLGMRSKAFALVLLLLLSACAQAVEAQTAAFEVVSIKPSAPDSKFSQTTYDPGRLFARGVSLKQLIEWAYQVTPAQVSGGPGWMDSKYFDVEAKADGEYKKDDLLRMLQPVLDHRFKLALHRETKEMPVYALTAGANRSKLHETAGGPANVQIQFAPPRGDKTIIFVITGQSVSMQYLTDYLTGIFDRVVVDHTGLNGSFDFKTEVSLDETELTNKRAAVMTALSDALPQLGLRMEGRKEPVELLVIDRAEEPSAN